MPFAKINCFNHTDPTNVTTSVKDLPSLNNQYWDTGKRDRIIATSPTKGEDLQPTINTKYGRSELREFDPVTLKKTAIKIDQYGMNFIAARQAIMDLGPAGKAISIQWHGSSTRPLAKGQWYYDVVTDSYYLNVQVAKTYMAKEEEFVLVTGVKRGQIFDLLFGFDNGLFIAAYNWMNADARIYTTAINTDGSYSQDTGLYSKAGVYCQTDITMPYEEQREGQGQIVLFELDVYHGVEVDVDHVVMDRTAHWRVGEVFSLTAPERTVYVLDTPIVQQASILKLITQIQGNMVNGAKKTALANLTKLDTILATLNADEGKQVRIWVAEQRALLS